MATTRITIKDLQAVCARINRITGMPPQQYESGPNGMKACVGNYHISQAYGKQFDNGSKRVSVYFNNGSYELKAVDWDKVKDAGTWPEQHGWNDPAGFRFWENYTTPNEAIRAFKQQAKRLGFVQGK